MSKPTVLYFQVNDLSLRAICRAPSAAGVAEWVKSPAGLGGMAFNVTTLDIEREITNALGEKVWAPMNSNDMMSFPTGIVTAILAQQLARLGEGQTFTLDKIELEDAEAAARRLGLRQGSYSAAFDGALE